MARHRERSGYGSPTRLAPETCPESAAPAPRPRGWQANRHLRGRLRDTVSARHGRCADRVAALAWRTAALCLTILVGAPLESCALWGSAPEAPPQVQLVSVRLADRPGHSPRLRIALQIVNPGDRELAIIGLSCHLKINAVPRIDGFTGPLRVLPPRTALRVEVDARIDTIDRLKLTGRLADGTPPDYALKVHLRRAWKLPLVLTEAGTLPWEGDHGS